MTKPGALGYRYTWVTVAWQGKRAATWRLPDDERVVVRTFKSPAEAARWVEGFCDARLCEGYERIEVGLGWTINPRGQRTYFGGRGYSAGQPHASDVPVFHVEGGGPFNG